MKDDIFNLIASQSRSAADHLNFNKDALFSLVESGAQVVSDQAVAGVDAVSLLVTTQLQAASDQIEIWTAGGTSTFKVISGDFRPGRAVISMDGLKLRNRGNAVELVPFDSIKTIQKLNTEKRASTMERIKGATTGGVIGGGVGTVAGLMTLRVAGPMGAAVGGAVGALLSVKHKYHTCRVELRDDRKIIAVAANTNWLALMASIPTAKPARLRIGSIFRKR